jgi:hypothetical protein
VETWISDDAYITFRTVEVLAHRPTGESYFATLALSGVFTLA